MFAQNISVTRLQKNQSTGNEIYRDKSISLLNYIISNINI